MASDSTVPVELFVRHCDGQMVPLNQSLSYFSVIPLDDADLQRLIFDPASAIPPKLASLLPKLRIIIVAYLERSSGKNGDEEGEILVSFRPPARSRRLYSTVVERGDEVYIFLAVKGEDVADYHDTLYYEIARLIVRRAGDDLVGRFRDLVDEELGSEVRGEIDDRGWKLKQQVLRRQTDLTRNTKLMRDYLEQALADTLTLYLHGLCCDIDIEAGPRQLNSRNIRRRLTLLRDTLPPPSGVALFPEELAPQDQFE